MSKTSKTDKNIYKIFRILVIILLVGGFIYQTLEFLFLYWTYPTVVDIQESSPFYLDVPAFTFCNRIGYNFQAMCNKFDVDACAKEFASEIICKQFPRSCLSGPLPSDFQPIYFNKFMTRYSITKGDYKTLAVPLKDYFNCTIHFTGKTRSCNLDNVMGSFYSTEELPQFCFTIYSLWGNTNKKREQIPKGSIMKFKMFLNVSGRPKEMTTNMSAFVGPKYNLPTDATVQMSVHDPYFLPSPYFEGFSFKGGRAYELRIKLSERHLLPYPYQTNCTDYMSTWKDRGGKSPINQLGVIQECRLNKTLEAISCIPLDFDYPHRYNICKTCRNKYNCEYVEPPNDCAKLSDDYNQPCDGMTYQVERKDKVITVFKKLESIWATASDGIRYSMAEHNCEGRNFYSIECSTIEIEIPFDRFEITNITYNPKYESLELFSVIGGYMGMWLGVSLLAFFDMFTEIVLWMKQFVSKRQKEKGRPMKPKFQTSNNVGHRKTRY